MITEFLGFEKRWGETYAFCFCFVKAGGEKISVVWLRFGFGVAAGSLKCLNIRPCHY